jgi:ATP-dependent RNA helicase RhlE
MTFDKFELHPSVMAGVRDMGFETPTPIQSQAIPPAMEGRDLIGLAQTGTGKTAAFALPIINRLLKGPRRTIRALIIAPTRELADQINESVAALGKETHLKSACIYGGVNINPQFKKLRQGLDIVVACPGRLLDHMRQKTIDLSRVEVLVLDEADRMFDMGFLPDVRRIMKQLPSRRQTLLFSATMPDDVRALSSEFLNDPVTAQVGFLKPLATVTHALYPVAPHQKTLVLMELLRHDTESVIVFTRTKHRAKKVARQLEKAGHKAACLQGNLSQNRRTAAMEGFRKGSFKILVATDIASRGIDVMKISHVINYDMPDTADAYTHRIGRTGRLAQTGDAYTLSTPEDEAMIRTIERTLGEKLKRNIIPGINDDAPVQVRTEAVRHRAPRPGGSRPNRQGPRFSPRQPAQRRSQTGY